MLSIEEVSTKPKTLFVTDFDDTLAKTDAMIHVTDASGKKFTLSPEKYATYEANPGDIFDFSEFEQLKNPQPIHRFVKLLQRVVKEKKADKVAVLTARGHTLPVSQFLKMIGITSGVSIAAIGSSDPMKKANYIEKHIKDGYSRIAFMDDSPKNVTAVKSLQQKYPEVKLLVHHVKEPHSQSSSKKPTTRKQKIQQILNTRIKNPQTGNDILVRTALAYKKDHPAYIAAAKLIQRK
jgi:hypothetical protein